MMGMAAEGVAAASYVTRASEEVATARCAAVAAQFASVAPLYNANRRGVQRAKPAAAFCQSHKRAGKRGMRTPRHAASSDWEWLAMMCRVVADVDAREVDERDATARPAVYPAYACYASVSWSAFCYARRR